MKKKCALPCGGDYPLLLTLLQAPDQLDDNQEIETRDWNEWKTTGYAYGRVQTGSGREVLSASQTHGQVDAVMWTPWQNTTKDLTNSNAVKVNGSYYHIIAAINVDELNTEMQLICRKRTL